MSATEELAVLVTDTRASAFPEAAREQARRAFLDTLGVLIAGCQEDAPRILADWVAGQGGNIEASIIGHSLAATAADAALVNGTSAHALDWDDVSISMRGHPSAPLVPAILALGEKVGSPGSVAIEAYMVGFEVQARLGRASGEPHYALGWHATSTFGTVGAAAASARLLGLNEDRAAAALSIAASLASGVQANFGTMTKPLHAGWAARNGIVAASLAAAGLTASANALGAENGLLRAASGGRAADASALSRPLDSDWDIVTHGIGVKLYPCCYATHRAIDAALEARDSLLRAMPEPLDHGLLTDVEVKVSRGGLTPLLTRRPETALEGKFSMEYCLAAALLDGRVGLDTFSDAMVRRPEAAAIMSRIRVDDSLAPAEFPIGGEATVTLRTAGGDLFRAHVDTPRGDPSRPLSWDELAAKFRDATSHHLDSARCERAIDAIRNLDQAADLSRVVSLLA